MAKLANSGWFVRDHVGGQPRQIWLFDGKTAKNMSVSNPEGGLGTFFKAEPDEDIWDCIRRDTPWLAPDMTEGQFYPMILGPGEFYPRIARPIALADANILYSPWMETDFAYVVNSRSHLTLLVRKLETICHTVQPSMKTMDVYGHEIRNLLILAVTEIEMYFKGILTKNSSSASKLNTNEYFKLADPMKLRDYVVTFNNYPEIQAVSPFAEWDKSKPTDSLDWYAAYHGVKHNREGEFARGTLKNVFEAVAACMIMFVAQFGPAALNFELTSFVALGVPNWTISGMYLPRMNTVDWVPVNFPNI